MTETKTFNSYVARPPNASRLTKRYSENAGEGKGYGVSWKGLLDS